MNKKAGDEKYYIIISFILGMLIFGMAGIFIFKEYSNEGEITWETCAESIYLRAKAPGYAVADFKDLFPLKCKTFVYNVDYKDNKRLKKDILNLEEACNKLTGNGTYKIWPEGLFTNTPLCFPCARIHFTDEARAQYNNIGDIWIIYRYYSQNLNRYSKAVLSLIGLNTPIKNLYNSGAADSFIYVTTQDQFDEDLTSSSGSQLTCQFEVLPT